MKKRFVFLLTAAICATLSCNLFCACNNGGNTGNEISGSGDTSGNGHASDDGQTSGNGQTSGDGETSGNGQTSGDDETHGGGQTSDGGETSGGGQPSGSVTPSAAEVVEAIANYAESERQDYDFVMDLAGKIQVGIVTTPNAHATYDCQYRYNAQTEDLNFKRVTSGLLLYDSTEYIYSSGDSRITVKTDEDGGVKKVEVTDNEQIKLINLPFTELVTSLKEQDIKNISKEGEDGYTANLNLSSENAILSKLCGIFGNMDTSINLKGATFTNPVNGIVLNFKITDGKISDYSLSAQISVPVKGATTLFDLKYSQQASSAPVVIPSQANLTIDKSEISEVIGKINTALKGVKTQTAYSLDLEAENEMDPGWQIKATKDSYKSRLFKNTADGFTNFNNSFEYSSHREAPGSDKYKYTIGNIRDGSTYIVSRKGSNKADPKDGVSADSQFDYMTDIFVRNADEIDCLSKSVENGVTTYTVYLSNRAVLKASEDIVDILNSNPADGAVTVDNYFNNADYTVKDAILTVVIEGEEISTVELDTEIKYNPVDGDYTENNVTLNNRLKLTVNAEIGEAEKYFSPEKVEDGVFGLSGLTGPGRYIL